MHKIDVGRLSYFINYIKQGDTLDTFNSYRTNYGINSVFCNDVYFFFKKMVNLRLWFFFLSFQFKLQYLLCYESVVSRNSHALLGNIVLKYS